MLAYEKYEVNEKNVYNENFISGLVEYIEKFILGDKNIYGTDLSLVCDDKKYKFDRKIHSTNCYTNEFTKSEVFIDENSSETVTVDNEEVAKNVCIKILNEIRNADHFVLEMSYGFEEFKFVPGLSQWGEYFDQNSNNKDAVETKFLVIDTSGIIPFENVLYNLAYKGGKLITPEFKSIDEIKNVYEWECFEFECRIYWNINDFGDDEFCSTITSMAEKVLNDFNMKENWYSLQNDFIDKNGEREFVFDANNIKINYNRIAEFRDRIQAIFDYINSIDVDDKVNIISRALFIRDDFMGDENIRMELEAPCNLVLKGIQY